MTGLSPAEEQRLRAAQEVLRHAVSARDEDDIAAAQAGRYAALEVAPADGEALAAADMRRIRVYRRLVRGTLREAIDNQLPKTAARMGEDAYREHVVAFAEAELPRSQLLRDVAYEFAVWAAPRFAADARLPPWLADLARFELLEFDVYTAERFEVPLAADELVADRAVAFDTTARVGRFGHAVHLLGDEGEPEARPAGVLAYRDREGSYRQIDLTPLAAEILGGLLVRRLPFAPAVAAACEARNAPVDQSVIEGTATLMADLGERGVVLGAAAGDSPAPSPFFDWLFAGHFVSGQFPRAAP
jgi:hypothetical protein